MAKDHETSNAKSRKAAKHEKKLSRMSDDNGVTKVKKDKKATLQVDGTAAAGLLEQALEEGTATTTKKSKRKSKHAAKDTDADISMSEEDIQMAKNEGQPNGEEIKYEYIRGRRVRKGLLCGFAHPLADDKTKKRVIRGIHKAAKARHIKRGVKEVNKGIKNFGSTSSSPKELPNSVVIFAGDISPEDVISHMPIYCEDQNIPYIFIDNRSDLGIAASTKRPTSAVMVVRGLPKGKKPQQVPQRSDGDKENMNEDDEKKTGQAKEDFDPEEWAQVYKELVRVVRKAHKVD